MVSNGSYVSPSDTIIEIVDTDHIHLELSVFEKDILKIKKGQDILFTIPEATDSIFKADVHLVGTTIDETNRRVKIHGHIEEGQAQFVV
ncbi:MAG TPA: efflux transporter periplasmic adaptor subunit, partial [Xanthomarina gelatinilytica]|nr:efflux transporter periplasmic adaptor subunit [Xanthomarina gelatinilytica]